MLQSISLKFCLVQIQFPSSILKLTEKESVNKTEGINLNFHVLKYLLLCILRIVCNIPNK